MYCETLVFVRPKMIAEIRNRRKPKQLFTYQSNAIQLIKIHIKTHLQRRNMMFNDKNNTILLK